MLSKSRFVEMFGTITNNKKWEYKTIKEVAPAEEYKGSFGDKVWLLNLDAIEPNTGIVSNYNYVEKKEVGKSTCTFDETNVLYSKLRPYLNKVVLPKQCGFATSELIPLKPNTKIIDRNYLAFLLRSSEFVTFISLKVAGANLPRVNISDFWNFKIPVPPLDLQIKFNEVSNHLDKLKVILKQIDEKIELLKKSRFVEMFGDINLSHKKDSWKKISEVGEVIGGATPKTANDEFWNGDNKWITPAEIKTDSFYIYDTERHLSNSGVSSCALTLLPKDTVLLTSRAPIGKVAITGSEMFCNQGFKNIICKKIIKPQFLYYILKNNTFYLNSLGRGATFKEISKNIVENIKIPVPTLELQEDFIKLLNHLDKLKVAIHRELELLE